MSLGNQCQKCNKLLWGCTCKSNAKCIKFTPEQVYKELPEDFTRTDIERQPTVLDIIADVADLVETIPNDAELGAAVRKLFS